LTAVTETYNVDTRLQQVGSHRGEQDTNIILSVYMNKGSRWQHTFTSPTKTAKPTEAAKASKIWALLNHQGCVSTFVF